jgi:hypothetical protein
MSQAQAYFKAQNRPKNIPFGARVNNFTNSATVSTNPTNITKPPISPEQFLAQSTQHNNQYSIAINQNNYNFQNLQQQYQTATGLNNFPNRQLTNQERLKELQNQRKLSTTYQQPVSNNLIHPQIQEVNTAEQEMLKQYEIEKAHEDYHSQNLILGLFALGFYYIGSVLVTFFTNIAGEAVVTLDPAEISWQLLISDFPLFVSNLLVNVFGYFIQYGKLFGYFPEYGFLNVEPQPKHLMPLDIILKVFTIAYFHFFWMHWDTKKSLQKGFINSSYPYLKADTENSSNSSKSTADENINFDKLPENIDSEEFQKKLLSANQSHSSSQNTISIDSYVTDEEEDDEDDIMEDNSSLPFSGVHKPIEEFYHHNEAKIYGLIRTKILPGSNLIMCLYFSTKSVLSFQQPIVLLLYVLGIMSMFWCMQSFLLVLDHNQYPPEEEKVV